MDFALLGAAFCLINRMLRREGPYEHPQRLESEFLEQKHKPSPYHQYHMVQAKDRTLASRTGMGLDGHTEASTLFELENREHR